MRGIIRLLIGLLPIIRDVSGILASHDATGVRPLPVTAEIAGTASPEGEAAGRPLKGC